MKATLHAIYLLLAVMLAPTLFVMLEVFGVKANPFIVYTVFAGFYVTQREGIWLGLIYGLMYDIIVGVNVGLNGILFMFVCFLTVLFCENMIRRSNVVMSVICVAVWTVIVSGINSMFSAVSGIGYKLSVIGIEALYNGFVMLLLYVPMTRIFRKLYEEKR